MICYAWHNVPDCRNLENDIGNGQADGNYIDLELRPALVG